MANNFIWKPANSANVTVLEQKVQQLEQQLQTAEQKLTAAEQTIQQQQQELQTAKATIAQHTRQIGSANGDITALKNWKGAADPLIIDYRDNGAKLNQQNVFTQSVTFDTKAFFNGGTENRGRIDVIMDGAAIRLIQNNNPTFIEWTTGAGVRRGGVIGIENANDDFITIISNGEVSLKPRSNVNVNNGRILNVANPRTPTDAVNERSKN